MKDFLNLFKAEYIKAPPPAPNSEEAKAAARKKERAKVPTKPSVPKVVYSGFSLMLHLGNVPLNSAICYILVHLLQLLYMVC